jgi:outer membrane protein assembly factor BamB
VPNRYSIFHKGRFGVAALTCVAAGATAIALPLAQAMPVGAHAALKTKATIPAGFHDWIEHRDNAVHTGVSAETILSSATAFKPHWNVNTGTKSYASPAIAFNSTLNKSIVYIGNMLGEFNAYDAATGALIWHYQTPKTPGLSKEIEASAAVSVATNTVYFGDGDYHEYALNATTGALICKSPSMGGISASSPVIASPAGTGQVIYFGDAGASGNTSDGGHLWAMYGVGNTAGTRCSWDWSQDNFGSPPGSQTGLSGVYSTPAFGTLANHTPVVVVGSTDADDAIYAFNANTGAILWRFQTLIGIDSDVGAPPTIAEPGTIGAVGTPAYTDGVVYDTGKDGQTYALDLQTGAQIWTFNIKKTIHHGNPAQSGAALVGNAVYIGYGAGVFSLNATTGALNWTTPVAAPVISSISVTGPVGRQVMAVGDYASNVDVFSLATGANLFTFATGGPIFGSVGISTGQLFVASSDGKLYAFGN